jgi:hypothetical protein
MWFFGPVQPAPVANGWRRHANPFAGVSQEPMRLLHTITPIELANCVPIVKIVKIDNKGAPDKNVRPLMYDLVQTPQFGATGDFGSESDRFAERGLVSLNSLRLEYQQQYGPTMFRDVTIAFTVHKPALVFSREKSIPWRDIMIRGGMFSLEYGWSADPSVVKNGLFNGHGIVTPQGLVIRSTQTVLLNIHWVDYTLKADGSVDVTVKALENGDIALRQSRIADVYGKVKGLEDVRRNQLREAESRRAKEIKDDKATVLREKKIDQQAATDVINNMLSSVEPINEKGRKPYIRIGDVLDRMIAPMVRNAVKSFGYTGVSGEQPVELLLGDFNERAGRQSKDFGGGPMKNKDIGEFQIPLDKLKDGISNFFATGRQFYLYDFIEMAINLVNKAEGWGQPAVNEDILKPELVLKSDTLPNGDGSGRLVMVIYDRMVIGHSADKIARIPYDDQTRHNVMKSLSDANIPVIEFGRAGSLIQDATFQVQPDTQLQSIQIDNAYSDQKDRVQQTQMPDTESRRGSARDGDLTVPISILEGTVTMQGNFANDVFTLLWIEFYGASEISGFFHINGKTDTLEPGKFTSEFKFISEGIDPLNTRNRFTDAEISANAERERAMKEKAATDAAKKKKSR